MTAPSEQAGFQGGLWILQEYEQWRVVSIIGSKEIKNLKRVLSIGANVRYIIQVKEQIAFAMSFELIAE